MTASSLVADIDCLLTLAHDAMLHNWTKPTLQRMGSKHFEMKELRHACLDIAIGPKYIPSDFEMSHDKHVAIITGPNMGGKSTFMRGCGIVYFLDCFFLMILLLLSAVGLCVLLAQMGSFVPCSSASIPMMDRIAARVGASDSIRLGISTFMVILFLDSK